MTPIYSATVTAHGGREGRVESEDGKFVQSLSMPKELGGPGGDGTNPEQLFAAGYSACFESALRLVARLQKVSVPDVSISAKVTLGTTDPEKFKLAVELTGRFTDVAPEKAHTLMAAAHQICPYSMATRNNVEVTLKVA